MAKKPLPTPDELRQLLRYEPDTGKLFWRERLPDSVNCARESTRVRICRNWNARFAGEEVRQSPTIRGHAYVAINCVKLLTHRVIWAIYHAEWPRHEIDHINGNRVDNRLCNLRDIPHQENMKNVALNRDNKSGHHGIWWDDKRGKYQAFIADKSKRIALGRFNTIEEAVAARGAAELVLGFHRNHGRDLA